MEAVESFFAMGGYALYVWPCLIATAAVMLGLLVVSRRKLRENQKAVEQLEASLPDRETRRAARGAASEKQEPGGQGGEAA